MKTNLLFYFRMFGGVRVRQLRNAARDPNSVFGADPIGGGVVQSLPLPHCSDTQLRDLCTKLV